MLRRIIEPLIIKMLKRNEFTSKRLRAHFSKRYGIHVGMYSYGCFDPNRIGPETYIGRYTSVAPTAYALRRNHGIQFITTHPAFYNRNFDFPLSVQIPFNRCDIGDDVWIGHSSVILPAVSTIGRGAIIAAGSVVTKDVVPYGIVGGNPAKLIRMRFAADVIDAIEGTRWWAMSIEELGEFCKSNRALVLSPGSYFGEIK